jgi:tetratricopeptide (TPR) repeat protein
LDPYNANYYNCRGNGYFSLGEFQSAAEDFSAAIAMSPEASHGRYFNNRGSAYRRLKKFKAAIDDYTSAIAADPKNGNYYNNRGNAYFDMGEFQAAIDDFTTAMGCEPYSPKTRLTLAQAQEALAQVGATEFSCCIAWSFCDCDFLTPRIFRLIIVLGKAYETQQ